jgi:hypothetical protein
MVRLRLLSALLGCLAVVAASLPAYAFAWTPTQAAGEHAVIGALCSQHCPDCEGMPCPPTAEGCIVACVGVTPVLGTAAFTFVVPPGDVALWSQRLSELHGLSPPPDPFPPRS